MIEKLKKLNLLYIEDNVTTMYNYLKTFNIIFNNIFTAINHKEAIDLYKKETIDIVLVDIELNTQKNGFDIANEIRQSNQNIPIIFLTGHDETEFVQKAINSTMNGYIIKPLNLDKLINITEKIFKKVDNSNIVEFNNYKYNFNTFELFNENGKTIPLGKKENALLQIFLNNKYSVLSRDFLEHSIWDEPLSSESTLKNLIAALRKKIGKNMIINISKLGWRINLD